MTPHIPDPVESLKLSRRAVGRLQKQGIVCARQLQEHVERFPEAIEKIVELPAAKVVELIAATHPKIVAANDQVEHVPLPRVGGIIGPPEASPVIAKQREKNKNQRMRILSLLESRHQVAHRPRKVVLAGQLSPPRFQGPYGYCAGFPPTDCHEFNSRIWLRKKKTMSPGYAYRGAKYIDGFPDVEGTHQQCVAIYFHKIGHVSPAVYSYEDAINGRNVEEVFDEARENRTDGYIDLLPDPDNMDLVPYLIKAANTGTLLPELPPIPVAISLALYESFGNPSVQRGGILTKPHPGEPLIGYHALLGDGFVEADHPSSILSQDQFLMRNTHEGAQLENPYGLRHHLVVPESYLTSAERVVELLVLLGPEVPEPTRKVLHMVSRAGSKAIRALLR